MAAPPTKVDRQQTTPFHLKLFYRNGGFHRLDEFSPISELPPHLQIYTWQTCTLRELSHLLTSALPSLLPDPAIGTRLAFRLIYADTRNLGPGTGPGRYMTKDLGSIVIGDGGPGILPDEEEAGIVAGGQMAGPLGGEPDKTLQDARFVIGDYVSCAIMAPLANGAVAPSPLGATRGGGEFGRGRPQMGMGGEFGGRGGGGGGGGGFGGPRDNGFGGGYRGRGGMRGGGNFGQGNVPTGEWRRGERVPEGPSGRGGGGRGYGGGFGGGGGGGGGRGGRY